MFRFEKHDVITILHEEYPAPDWGTDIQLDCSSVRLWDYAITFAVEVRF